MDMAEEDFTLGYWCRSGRFWNWRLVQSYAKTPQVHPCRLPVAIHGDRGFAPLCTNLPQHRAIRQIRPCKVWERREKPNPRLLWVLTLTDCRKLTGNTNVSGRRMMVE